MVRAHQLHDLPGKRIHLFSLRDGQCIVNISRGLKEMSYLLREIPNHDNSVFALQAPSQPYALPGECPEFV
jgi:hypothetical protein